MEEQLQSTTARARGILCGLSHAGLPRDPRCGLHSRIRTIASRQEHENAAGILTDLRISRTAARPHHGVQATPGVRSQGSRIRCCTCLHRRAVHRALCRSGARYHACRASGAYGGRATPRRPPIGAELQARGLDARASGAAVLSGRRRGVTYGYWPWVARCCRADQGRGAVHSARPHAHEPAALGARPRSRFRRDAHVAGALGRPPCGRRR